MTEYLLLYVIAALALASFCLLLFLLKRSSSGADPTQAALLLDMAQLKDANERLERGLRAEVQASAQGTRSELAQTLTLFQQALLAQSGDVARTQNEQIDSFRVQLAAMQQQVAQTLQTTTQALTQQAQAGSQALAEFAQQEGVSTLRLAGLRKVRQGVTSLDEVLANTGYGA
jgi:DNA recombination protein RmuC